MLMFETSIVPGLAFPLCNSEHRLFFGGLEQLGAFCSRVAALSITAFYVIA
jgi:hypothetical protein